MTKKTSKANDEIGHNSGISGKELRAFIERIEKVAEEKAALQEDIKEIFAEAKSNGFDVKIMRKLISMRKIDPSVLEEQTVLISIYAKALGMTLGEMYA